MLVELLELNGNNLRRKFLYQTVKQGARSREYEDALLWLSHTGLVRRIFRISKPGLPLSAYDTWNKFYNKDYEASFVHYGTLVLVVINSILLLIRFKPALLMTGAILLFASLGLLHFFVYTSSFLTFFGITIPFEGWSFLILIFYFATNCDILINWQLDAKRKKQID